MTAETEELVGRQEELWRLDAFLDDASEAAAPLAFVGGPGIGKTSLWRKGVALAGRRGFRVLAARPAQPERELSFAALGDLLRDEQEAIGELPAPQRRALRVALLLEDPHGKAPDARAIGVALAATLQWLSEPAPLLVAIDDVQWLDTPSRNVLEFAARRLDRGVRTLLCMRPEATWPGAERLELAGLDRGLLAVLLRRHLGTDFHPRVLVQIERVSGGNPFYALELGRAVLAHKGLAHDEPLPVPPTLHGLASLRLDVLAPATREELLRAAVLGRVSPDLVVPAAVAEALAAAVLTRAHGELSFAHPLFASVLYDDATPSERRAAHAAVAPLATDNEEHARHLAAAADAADEEIAVALDEAARRARARGAPVASAELAEQAVRLTPAESDAVHRRVLAAASFAADAGDIERAAALADKAVGRASSSRERAEALRTLGDVMWLSQSRSGCREVYESALAAAGDDVALGVSIEARLCRTLHMGGDPVEAERRAVAVVELAERAGEPAQLVDALVRLAVVRFDLGRGLQTELLERAIALGRGAGWTLDPRTMLAHELIEAGEFDAARPLLEELLAEADAAADFSAAQILGELGRVEFYAGNWVRSHEYVERGLELALQSGRTQAEIVGRLTRGRSFTHLGMVEEARADLDRALALAEELWPVSIDGVSGMLGVLELFVGDAAAAHERLAPVTEHYRDLEWSGLSNQWFLMTDAEALIELGQLEAARRLADVLSRQKAIDDDLGRARVAYLRGLIAAAAGDLETALADLQRSLVEHEQTRQPFNIARTLLALGTVERRARRNIAARGSLARALALFEQLGARLHVERAKAEAARVSGRRPSPGKLTETERRIAELVARGKSNHEIAGELFVSPKTVEWNLTKIYRKLHVASRTELAAKLAKRQTVQ